MSNPHAAELDRIASELRGMKDSRQIRNNTLERFAVRIANVSYLLKHEQPGALSGDSSAQSAAGQSPPLYPRSGGVQE